MAKKSSNERFMKPLKLTPALSAVVGKGPMPRTQVTKKLWEYIKKHKCQHPVVRRNIVPDKKLEALFGSKPIDMFEMSKKLNKHLS